MWILSVDPLLSLCRAPLILEKEIATLQTIEQYLQLLLWTRLLWLLLQSSADSSSPLRHIIHKALQRDKWNALNIKAAVRVRVRVRVRVTCCISAKSNKYFLGLVGSSRIISCGWREYKWFISAKISTIFQTNLWCKQTRQEKNICVLRLSTKNQWKGEGWLGE